MLCTFVLFCVILNTLTYLYVRGRVKLKSFFKIFLAFLLIPCLLFSGCTKNILLTIYYIDGDTILAKQVKAEEFSAGSILEFLKSNGVIASDTVLNDFKNEGSDTYRQLSLDFGDNFRIWLSSQTAGRQKLIMQSVANTFLHNFSADNIKITVDGQAVKTGLYDFTEPLVLTHVGITEDEITVQPYITPTPEPTPEPTPKITPSPTPIVTVAPSIKPDNGKKQVAMTFDDGPHSVYTKKLVDVCKKYNAGATFFIIGNRVNEKTGEAIKYASQNGCEIAIHGYTHEVYYDKCSDSRFEEEMSKTAQVIKQYTGKTPTMMRPVGGRITEARVKNCDYSVIQWNVDSEDWRHKKETPEEVQVIVNNVMNTVGPGKIILMHEIYKNSYDAFVIIMEKLYAQGYEVVTVTELLGESAIKPGTKYFGR